MIIFFLILLTLLLLVSIYVIWNLNKKVTALELYCGNFLSDLTTLRDKITAANTIIHQADLRGAFESDDEVGGAFKLIKNCIEILNDEAKGNGSTETQKS